MKDVFGIAIFGNSLRQQGWSVCQSFSFIIGIFYTWIFEWKRTWWAQNITFVFILLRIWASHIRCLLSLLLTRQFPLLDIPFKIGYFLIGTLLVSQIMYNRWGPLLLRILMIKHTLPLRGFLNLRKHHFKWLLLMNYVILLSCECFFGGDHLLIL